MIGLPHYIVNAQINNQHIDYVWDDNHVSQPLNVDIAPPFIRTLEQVSLRGKIALVIGCYEWVVGRYSTFVDQSFFLQIQEAAWCANINKSYIRQDLFFSRSNFLGPIQGAMWCAYSSLIPVLYVSQGMTEKDLEDEDTDFLVEDYLYDGDEWKDGLNFLIPLIVHILPSDKVPLFLSWLEAVTQRLVKLYTMPEEDPFDNLWGHKDDKSWLGDYVAREALDPDFDFQPEQVIPLLNQFLQRIDKTNPFLTPFNFLKEKIKIPFKIEE